MKYLEELASAPERFDLFNLLRNLEQSSPEKPKIGNSVVVEQDIVSLFQDPFLEFPAKNVTYYHSEKGGPYKVGTRFLGFFGPQGALPLSSTVEAQNWLQAGDRSFSDFTNLFSNRYLQLFFRVWSDTRPITQADRLESDKFKHYIGSMIGLGSSAFEGLDSVSDLAKLPYAGLIASQVKSICRLKQFLQGLFNVNIFIEERALSWLVFDKDGQLKLGVDGGQLGIDTVVGTRIQTINEKIIINLEFDSLEEYENYLPSGEKCVKFADAVFFYFGHRYDFEMKLHLPARCAPGVKLGTSGELGWNSWMRAEELDQDVGGYLDDAKISPLMGHLAHA